jgi:hypothetical protein
MESLDCLEHSPDILLAYGFRRGARTVLTFTFFGAHAAAAQACRQLKRYVRDRIGKKKRRNATPCGLQLDIETSQHGALTDPLSDPSHPDG